LILAVGREFNFAVTGIAAVLASISSGFVPSSNERGTPSTIPSEEVGRQYFRNAEKLSSARH